jgi:hypothetical protein
VDTLHAVAITCCDVGDMAIGYVVCGAITYCDVGDMALGYVACGGILHCDVGDMAMDYVETKVEPKRGISIRGISIHGSR